MSQNQAVLQVAWFLSRPRPRSRSAPPYMVAAVGPDRDKKTGPNVPDLHR
jgi:hypothetical protein